MKRGITCLCGALTSVMLTTGPSVADDDHERSRNTGSQEVLIGDYSCTDSVQSADLIGTSGLLSVWPFQCFGEGSETCEQTASAAADMLKDRRCKVGAIESFGGGANMSFVCSGRRDRVVRVISGLCGGFLP